VTADEPAGHPADSDAGHRADPVAGHQADPTHPHTHLGDLAEHRLLPAWRRVTDGEARWPAVVAVLVAIGLQYALPQRLALGKTWIIPAVQGALLAGLTVISPHRITRHIPRVRVLSLLLIAALTIDNITSAARLIRGVINGTESTDPTKLLLTGAAIWLANVIVFSLWYWEFDRGGPGERATASDPYPDFVFPQMQSPSLAAPDWEPSFVDYLYMSFTNATAFSPTDTLPFSRWAKVTMMTQSAVSLVTVALVIARAVNILKV
jgi:uncharacterized membrane protein